MFGGMGMTEIILIFLVVLLLFGAKRLPEIGASLGKGIREFKGSLREIESELKVDDAEPRNRKVQKPPAEDDQSASTPRRLTSSESRPEAPSSPTSPASSTRTTTSSQGDGEDA